MTSDRRPTTSPSADEVLRARVKAQLRKRMRALRQTTPAAACAARSARIVDRLCALDVIACARAVALYWPIEDRHEVDLRDLDARLRQRAVRVAYPWVAPDAPAMTFRFVAHLDSMREGALGLKQPSADDVEAAPGELDVIVVPALAVDPRGHRIGYGAGYYDRALPRFVPPAVAVVAAFDFQLVPETPRTQDDVAVEWIVTDAREMAAEPDTAQRS